MIVTNIIKMDLQEMGYVPSIDVVQNDRYCRNLDFHLFSGGEKWLLPEGAAIVIRYHKADGTGGEYDTLPDGSIAWSCDENVIAVALAPQVLTVPGPVKLSVSICEGDAQITTFGILLNVQAQVGAEVTESGDYYCVPRFVPAPKNAEVGQFFRVTEVDSQGRIAAVEAVDIVEGREAVCFTEQTLTQAQQIQARTNIGAVSEEEILMQLEGNAEIVNLLEETGWVVGYVTTDGSLAELEKCNNGEVCTAQIVEAKPGGAYRIQNLTSNAEYAWLAYAEYDAAGNFLRRFAFDAYNGQFPEGFVQEGGTLYELPIILSEDAYGVRVCGRTFQFKVTATEAEIQQVLKNAGSVFQMVTEDKADCRLLPIVTEAEDGKLLMVKNGVWRAVVPQGVSQNQNIRSINHRGYHTVAPENTLSAFRLSRRMGFDHVEADVSFTADGYGVILHDGTVDRTSNGTGSIGEMTLAEVRQLDFGSWKSAAYAGEKIPTFEEWILLCRNLGLHAYIDIKAPVTQAQVEMLVKTVKRYGMAERVTWITAAGAEVLNYVKNKHPKARLGLICDTVTEEIIHTATELKNGENVVFLDAVSSALTGDLIEKCAEQEIPLEVWDLWSEEQILEADGYISGFTTDEWIAGEILCKAELV